MSDEQKIILIKRFHMGIDATNGAMFDGNDLFATTLELPWKNNQRLISCIPKGEYLSELVLSPRFKVPVWRLIGVPNRDYVEVHPANKIADLQGCIAPAKTLQIREGPDEVYSSKVAFNELMYRTQNCKNIKIVITEV